MVIKIFSFIWLVIKTLAKITYALVFLFAIPLMFGILKIIFSIIGAFFETDPESDKKYMEEHYYREDFKDRHGYYPN